MLAEAIPTTFDWLVLSVIWLAWLWLPVAFLVFAMWRKRITLPMVVCFIFAESAAIVIVMR